MQRFTACPGRRSRDAYEQLGGLRCTRWECSHDPADASRSVCRLDPRTGHGSTGLHPPWQAQYRAVPPDASPIRDAVSPSHLWRLDAGRYQRGLVRSIDPDYGPPAVKPRQRVAPSALRSPQLPLHQGIIHAILVMKADISRPQCLDHGQTRASMVEEETYPSPPPPARIGGRSTAQENGDAAIRLCPDGRDPAQSRAHMKTGESD